MASSSSIASSSLSVTSATSSAAAIAAAAAASSSSSPCAACKFLRRKCQPDCVFAPYFPPDNPQKFIHVHRVFGASNVTKLLNELHPYQREDAVNSLAYEADMRLRDPVYGCVGVISVLQHELRQLQIEISRAKNELSKYQSTFGINPGGGATYGSGPIGISNHPVGIGGGAGLGFGREQLFPMAPGGGGVGREQNMMMMMRNYEAAEMSGRIGSANGSYDAGIVAAMNASAASIGQLNNGQFMKPSAAGGDERHSIGPS